MAEFKKHPFIPWYMSDWLNDPHVRALDAEHKGFWIDLLCQMALFFPYGHCSKLNIPLLKRSKIPALKNFSVESLVNQNSNQGVDMLVLLQVALPVEDQLSLVENMEDKLHLYLPYSKEQVKVHIKAIEDEGVCSRTPGGILYSRRLVKDFRKRVTAFNNGSQGGNPLYTGIKPKEKRKTPRKTLVTDLVNQNSNQGVGNLVNLSPDIDNESENDNIQGTDLSNQSDRKEGGTGETNLPDGANGVETPAQTVWQIAKMGYVSVSGFSDKVTEGEWKQWAAFVQLIEKEKLQDIYIAKFVNPNDFAIVLRENNFSEVRWLPVLKRMLATGMKPEHNLYHRIPTFIGYVYPKGKGSDLHTGNQDYSDQDKW